MKNRTVIGIICIVAALIISFGVVPLTNRILDNKTELLRVKRNVRAGQQITADDIELVPSEPLMHRQMLYQMRAWRLEDMRLPTWWQEIICFLKSSPLTE